MPLAAAIEAAIIKETGSDSTSESSQTSPALGGDSGVESASANAAAKPEPGKTGVATELQKTEADDSQKAQKTKHELLQEKLAHVREQRQAQQIAKRAKAEADATKTDREAAKAERAKWEALKNGTFLEGMKALGRDPREAFEQMKDEAINAGKPEYQIKQMQERFDAALKEAVEPLKKTIEELTAERAQAKQEQDAREHNARFSSDFATQIKSPDFLGLVIEYGEERLESMVRGFVTNPGTIEKYAKALGVDLTHADGRFSMREALTVLRRAQEQHEAQKQSRVQKNATPSQAASAPAEKKPTVNGTTERSGNPLGNQPASSRASTDAPKRPRTTRAERIEKLIKEDGR
jgi:hypothetical protein